MAVRLLHGDLLRQLRNARNVVSLAQWRVHNGSQVHGAGVSRMGLGHAYRVQLLHVKVYDKDVGFDAQRQANKYKLNEPQVQRDSLEVHRNAVKHTAARQEEQNMECSAEASDEADTFGNAATREEQDEGDLAEEEYTKHPPKQRLRPIDYARLIKGHLNDNRLKDAIAVLEQQMKQDRAKPDTYIYNLLISGCAKAGYTRKAFNLFTKQRQRGLRVTGGTYTSLFNACANGPSASDGLQRANHLREIMLEKGYEPNVKNYNAMIKAYGRCGDVKTAYLLADDMMERGLEVNADTFNFLLQACASDKEYGFRHSLLTWHKMLKRSIAPNYYTFSTILRCVRDCGFGDLVTMEQVLQKILNERKATAITADTLAESQTLSADGNQSEIATTPETTNVLQVNSEATRLEMPNLLAIQPHLGSMLSLSEVTRPHERFLLLGGIGGFMDLMKQNRVTPDIEMFTAMLEVVPPTYAAEKQILSFIRKIGLKADIDFFNILIKKRSMRFDYEGAREVLSMIRTARLHPDIVTYGVLALSCQTEDEARQLLQEMRNNGVRMNTQILGAMLRQGCAHKNFQYVIEIMQISLDEHIKPNEAFLTHLHNFYNRCARAIDARVNVGVSSVVQESIGKSNVEQQKLIYTCVKNQPFGYELIMKILFQHPSTKTKEFKKWHHKFCDKLRLYHEEHGIAGLKLEDAIKKIKTHPYEQYKEPNIDGLEPLKNEKITKKQKLRKYIRKIKIENLRSDEAEQSPPEATKQSQLE